jgi:hypothetical protein
MARMGNMDGAPPFYIVKAFDTSDETLTPAAFKFRVVDVLVQCHETNASGTVKLQRNGTDVTSTIVCDTNHEVSSLLNADGAGAPGTIDDAQYVFSKGDIPKLVPANSANGTAFILCVRV